MDPSLRTAKVFWDNRTQSRDFNYADYPAGKLEATIDKRNLTVSVRQAEGNMTPLNRTLRIGLVHHGRVEYSAWQSGNEASMKIKKSVLK